jgi:glycosyltransferase involved in cell wall biosynthesis
MIRPSSPRVLLLIKSISRGGAEHQCCLLAGQLADAGYSVRLIVYNDEDAIYKHLLPHTVQFVSLHCRRWNMLGLLFGLLRQIHAYKPKVVYGFMSHSNLLLLAVAGVIDAKIVCGIRSSKARIEKASVIARFGEWLHKKALHFADLVIPNSYAGSHDIAALGVSPDRISVVVNGVDTSKFIFNATARLDLRAALGILDDTVAIGMFGRFHPLKNHAMLLEAMMENALAGKRFKLLFIGDGAHAYKSDLMARADQLGMADQILMLDGREDVNRYYSVLDIYCSCSDYEGFSNVLAEAMSVGLRCIATDVGDSRKIIGGTGIVVPPRDQAALSAALKWAMNSPDCISRAERRAHIAGNFSLEQLGQRTMKAIDNILDS